MEWTLNSLAGLEYPIKCFRGVYILRPLGASISVSHLVRSTANVPSINTMIVDLGQGSRLSLWATSDCCFQESSKYFYIGKLWILRRCSSISEPTI